MVRILLITLLFASCKKERCYQCEYFQANGNLIYDIEVCTSEEAKNKKEIEQKYSNETVYLRCR
jgi:hypothetical protein